MRVDPKKGGKRMDAKLGRKMVEACHCEQCGHIWLPRSEERPGLCPKCKSLRWDKPKREAAIVSK